VIDLFFIAMIFDQEFPLGNLQDFATGPAFNNEADGLKFLRPCFLYIFEFKRPLLFYSLLFTSKIRGSIFKNRASASRKLGGGSAPCTPGLRDAGFLCRSFCASALRRFPKP